MCGVRWIGRIAIAVGLAGVVAAGVIGLWPLRANGVTGSALRPHYSEYFSVYSLRPLPDRPTPADFRRAGVRLPIDAVHDRRRIVYDVFACGVLLTVAGAAASSRRPRRP